MTLGLVLGILNSSLAVGPLEAHLGRPHCITSDVR